VLSRRGRVRDRHRGWNRAVLIALTKLPSAADSTVVVWDAECPRGAGAIERNRPCVVTAVTVGGLQPGRQPPPAKPSDQEAVDAGYVTTQGNAEPALADKRIRKRF